MRKNIKIIFTLIAKQGNNIRPIHDYHEKIK